MSISIVQTSARASFPGSGGAGTSTSITLSGVAANNTIVVLNCASGAPASGASNITVSDGTSYTQGAQKDFNYTGSNYVIASIHFLPAAASGSHVIVSSMNNTGGFNCYGFTRAIEVAGLIASPLDVTNIVNSGTGTTVTTGSSGALAQASEIVLAVYSTVSNSNVTISEPSGFSNIDNNATAATFSNFALGSMDYAIVSATTALNANWGASSGGNLSGWGACLCSLKGIVSSPTAIAAGQLFVLP